MNISEQELQIFSRHLILKEFDEKSFNNLQKQKITILGLGGIGLQPYLLAGIGSYRLDAGGTEEAQTNRGFHGGFGVGIGALGFGGFAEIRFVSISGDTRNIRYIPVTLGLRF